MGKLHIFHHRLTLILQGVPKFYRFISERYPLISTVVAQDSIPEFDNLYLDMNGIIHNCAHPTDMSFLSQEQILLSIFNYIDHIYRTIKPQKLFFMAVDGVAPRAKMNQQRSRRFRTAKQAQEDRASALRKGTVLPDVSAFDSNCITPGTEFMVELSKQMQYFCNKKVTEDPEWQNVEIILSGHEAPGEGEHKIMEYIRLAKSNQDTYDSNLRHCLYGLDADLIMLGLLSHEPHFALLREEVTFGRKKATSRGSAPSSSSKAEQTQFHLLHLSLFREYLDLEFVSLKGVPDFNYNLERIIDDFILLGFFIGNDFLPHLPGIHINEGSLSVIFGIYKKITLETKEYLQSSGTINLNQLQLLLTSLSTVEHESFKSNLIDTHFIRSKKSASKKDTKKTHFETTDEQLVYVGQIKEFLNGSETEIKIENDMPIRSKHIIMYQYKANKQDSQFIRSLCDKLGLVCGLELDICYPEDEDHDDAESMLARNRVMLQYESATVTKIADLVKEINIDEDVKYANDFEAWKSDYYHEKLNFKTTAEKEKMVFHYIEGLQWVLYYYYRGCPSWEWFYPYYYAPKITDLHSFPISFEFNLGTPFLPYQQLMAVLPSASSDLIPDAYRNLMIEGSIIDFYPTEFEQDLNGKKSDWEAVVKVPFIDEARLISALESKNSGLTQVERQRNKHGTSFIFTFTENTHMYPSSLPGVFPDIFHCKCSTQEYNLPIKSNVGFLNELCLTARTKARLLPGFPSLYNLNFTSSIAFAQVSIFQSPSSNESIIVHLEPSMNASEYVNLIGKSVFVGYPYLCEAKVNSVSDDVFNYLMSRDKINRQEHTPQSSNTFLDKCDNLSTLSSKYGIEIGCVDVIISVFPFMRTFNHDKLFKFQGMKLMSDGSLIKEFSDKSVDYAAQLCITQVEYQRNIEKPAKSVEEEYPINESVFCLDKNYGCPAEVVGHSKGMICLKLLDAIDTINLSTVIQNNLEPYLTSSTIAKKLKVNGYCLSRITSSIFMMNPAGDRINIGLGMKFEGKQKKVVDMSRKSHNVWEYSEKAFAILEAYRTEFPEIWKFVDRYNSDDFYEADRIFGDNVQDRIQDLIVFIKQAGIKSFEQVPIENESLAKEQVHFIEGFVKASYDDISIPFSSDELISVKREDVLKSSYAQSRLSNQKFALGHRIMNVSSDSNVPIGIKGSVIAIQGDYVDVVFDRTFIEGSSLDGRCSEYKGLSVKKWTILNLTVQQVTSVEPQALKQSTVENYFERNKNSELRFKGNYGRVSDNNDRQQRPSAINPWKKDARREILDIRTLNQLDYQSKPSSNRSGRFEQDKGQSGRFDSFQKSYQSQEYRQIKLNSKSQYIPDTNMLNKNRNESGRPMTKERDISTQGMNKSPVLVRPGIQIVRTIQAKPAIESTCSTVEQPKKRLNIQITKKTLLNERKEGKLDNEFKFDNVTNHVGNPNTAHEKILDSLKSIDLREYPESKKKKPRKSKSVASQLLDQMANPTTD